MLMKVAPRGGLRWGPEGGILGFRESGQHGGEVHFRTDSVSGEDVLGSVSPAPR